MFVVLVIKTFIIIITLLPTLWMYFYISSVVNITQPSVTRSSLTHDVMVGIFSTCEDVERRDLIRASYNRVYPESQIAVRFVIGKANSTAYDDLRQEEEKFGDLILLDCDENMNKGKTWSYFKHIYEHLSAYKYVVKSDQDSWINLDRLQNWVQPLNETGTLFGHENYGFFFGMGYGLSWDLVRYIATSSEVANNTEGSEDRLTTSWITDANLDTNRTPDNDRFIEFPTFTRELGPHEHNPPLLINDTIVVHRLKETESWQAIADLYAKCPDAIVMENGKVSECQSVSQLELNVH